MGRERDGAGDKVPSADEESRNTLEVTGGRGEAWSTNSTQRPKSEKARPRQGVEHHRCHVPSALQQQGKRWAIREGGDTSDGVRG